jgi:hypothetical protein
MTVPHEYCPGLQGALLAAAMPEIQRFCRWPRLTGHRGEGKTRHFWKTLIAPEKRGWNVSNMSALPWLLRTMSV